MSKKDTRTNIFSWKMSDEELQNQVDNYDTLKITESYKGISTIILLAILALSLILGFFNVIPVEDVLYSLIIYIPIIFFVYRGHRWAIISIMILWTIEKAITLFAGGSVLSIFWWAIVIPYFYKALKVENERKKIEKISSNKIYFCENCGNKIKKGTKFCTNCGKKI